MEYKFHSVTTAISVRGAALAPGGMLSPRKQRSNLEGAIEGSHQTREPTVNALTAVQWRRGEKQGRGGCSSVPTYQQTLAKTRWLAFVLCQGWVFQSLRSQEITCPSFLVL